MGKIPEAFITKTGTKTESFYDYLLSHYVANYFTIFLRVLGFKSPNLVTLLSFLLIIVSGLLVLNFNALENLYYRIVVAFIIQLSFIMDCSDGQLARIIGKTSRVGAWFDKVLDRTGEFFIFTLFGVTAWRQTGNVLFLFLGITTGYALSAFTLAMTLSDSIRLENLKKVIAVRRMKEQGKIQDEKPRRSFKTSRFAVTLSRVFFFLNFGIGERYLYLSFFLVINRIDIMLCVASFLATLRFLSISYYVGSRLRRIDGAVGRANG